MCSRSMKSTLMTSHFTALCRTLLYYQPSSSRLTDSNLDEVKVDVSLLDNFNVFAQIHHISMFSNLFEISNPLNRKCNFYSSELHI